MLCVSLGSLWPTCTHVRPGASRSANSYQDKVGLVSDDVPAQGLDKAAPHKSSIFFPTAWWEELGFSNLKLRDLGIAIQGHYFRQRQPENCKPWKCVFLHQYRHAELGKSHKHWCPTSVLLSLQKWESAASLDFLGISPRPVVAAWTHSHTENS